MILKLKFCFCFLFFSITFYSCVQTTDNTANSDSNNHINIGEKIILHSDVLNEEREIRVYVPKEFYGMDETELKYPVTYVMDGESQFLSTVGMLEQMSSPYSANDLIPQMIVVGIVNTDRNRDLTPTPGIMGRDSSSIHSTGGADQLTAFIEKELIPYIDNKYPTSQHRVLIGHSLGGLFVLNALIKYPDLFQNYLAIDPFLRWDKQNFAKAVEEKLIKGSFKDKRLFIATSNTRMSWMNLEDVYTDTSDVMYAMKSTLEFKHKLDTFDLDISYVNKYYEDENHFQIPIKATYDGYRFFYDFYAFKKMMDYYYPGKEEEDLIQEIEKHYKKVSDKMGYNIQPMESYINSWAYGFIQFDRMELARQLFDMNIRNYPLSSNVYSAKGYYLLGKKDTIQAIDLFEKALKIKEVSHVTSTLEKLKK